MLSGVHIICFAASYAVALVLEISRPLFRSALRGTLMLGFAGAGWIAHTAFLYYQVVDQHRSLLATSSDWYLLAAWALVLVYLGLTWFHPQQHFGALLLPLVLGLIATAAWLANWEPFAREPASKALGILHAMSILLATVSVLVGFAAGIMYLSQVRRLKGKRTLLAPLRLPSLEWLERANRRAILLTLAMLGLGVLSGVLLNLVNYRRRDPLLPWNDPVVLATLVMFVWLLGAVLVSAVYRPARRGSRVAYLTVVSFIFLAVALAMGLLARTEHGSRRNRPASAASVEQPGGGGP